MFSRTNIPFRKFSKCTLPVKKVFKQEQVTVIGSIDLDSRTGVLRQQGAVAVHFIDEKAKVNTTYYVKSLLPSHVADMLLESSYSFIFQQDRTVLSIRLNTGQSYI